MEKKSNKGLICLVIILIIALLGTVGYILVDKDIIKLKKEEKKTEEKVEESKNDELDIDSELVKSLHSRINMREFMSEEYDVPIYKQDELTQDTMDNKDKLYYGTFFLASSDFGMTNYDELDYKTTYELTKANYDKSYMQFFGNTNYEINNGDKLSFTHINMASGSGAGFTYDASKQVFVGGFGGIGGTSCHKYKTVKLYKAEESKTNVYLYEKVIFPEKADMDDDIVDIFSDYARKNKIDSIDKKGQCGIEIDINNYLDKASTFKITFKKESGNYYFEKSELIK